MGDVLGEGSYAKVKEAIDSETLVCSFSFNSIFLNFSCPDSAGCEDHEEEKAAEDSKRRGECREGDHAAEGVEPQERDEAD